MSMSDNTPLILSFKPDPNKTTISYFYDLLVFSTEEFNFAICYVMKFVRMRGGGSHSFVGAITQTEQTMGGGRRFCPELSVEGDAMLVATRLLMRLDENHLFKGFPLLCRAVPFSHYITATSTTPSSVHHCHVS